MFNQWFDFHRLELENHIGSLSILLFIYIMYIMKNSLKVLPIVVKKKKVAKIYFLRYTQLNFLLKMLAYRQFVKFFKIL